MGLLLGPGRCRRAVAGAAVDEHLLQRRQVVGGERLVAAQPLQGDVVLVLLEVRGGLGAEAFPVRAGGDAGQIDERGFAELVLRSRCRPTVFLVFSRNRTSPRSRSRASSSIGRVTSTHHSSPATSSSSDLLCGHRRDRGLGRAAPTAMFWTCLAQPLGGDGVAFELGELPAQDEQVEPLGVLVVVRYAWTAARPGARRRRRRPRRSASTTRRPLRVLLDQPAVRADEEVVEVHPDDDARAATMRCRRAVRARSRCRVLRRVGAVGGCAWSRAVTSPRRVSKSRWVSDFCSEPSEPGRSWLKYSRLPQKSKT